MTPARHGGKGRIVVSLCLLFVFIAAVLTVGFFLDTSLDAPSYELHQDLGNTNVPRRPEICPLLKHPSHDVQDATPLTSGMNHDHYPRRDLQVGHQRSFWVWDFNNQLFNEINATLLAVGTHGYVFMEHSCITELGETAATQQAEGIRDEFDSVIYPRVTDLSGHPDGSLGDIDGDPHIVILLSRSANYYSERNELDLPYSNMCEMVYLYYRTWLPYVAHEFQHLIWFNNEWDEPHYLLEGLSQYAEYYAGYLAPHDNIVPWVPDFLQHPEDSLLYWNMFGSPELPMTIDYGGAYLFTFYIAEHYGIDILRNLITEPTDGAYGVEAVLQAAGNDITFNELYLNWITAVTIDELGFGDNLYGFEGLDARISQYDTVNDPSLLNDTISLRYYGIHIHKLLSPPDTFTVQIKKTSNHTIGVSLALHDAHGWHTYQSLHDETNTTVTDTFTGLSADVAYLITSYMQNQTPNVVKASSYGHGPSTEIEISILGDSTSTTPTIPWNGANLGLIVSLSVFCGVSFLIAITILKKQKKSHEEN